MCNYEMCHYQEKGLLKKRDIQVVFLITSWQQMSYSYVPCFNRINFVVIPSYIELPWYLGLAIFYLAVDFDIH